jgi:hypothetical protein
MIGARVVNFRNDASEVGGPLQCEMPVKSSQVEMQQTRQEIRLCGGGYLQRVCDGVCIPSAAALQLIRQKIARKANGQSSPRLWHRG